MRRRTVQLTLTAALLLLNSRLWADLDQGKKSADRFASDVASTWFEQLCNVVKAERTTPPCVDLYGFFEISSY
jgi:hypothetical protein